MRPIVGLIAYVICITLSGAAVIAPVSRKKALSLVVFIAMSFGAGTGVFAILSFIMNMAGVRFGSLLVFDILIVGSVAGLFSISRPRTVALTIKRLSLPEIGLVAILVSVLALTFLRAVAVPMRNYDDRAKWSYKAMVLYNEGSVNVEAFRDPTRLHIDRRYPLLLPYLEAGANVAAGRFDDRLVKALFPLFLAALAGIIFHALSLSHSRAVAIVGALMFVAMPFLSESGIEPGGGAETAYADLPLALYYTAAIATLLQWRRNGDGLWLSSLFISFALFTKNEGIILYITWLASLGIVSIKPKVNGFSRIAIAALCPIIINIPFFIFSRSLPPDNINYVSNLTFAVFMQNAGRLSLIARYFLAELLSPQWGFIGIVLFVSIVLFPRRMIRYESLLIATTIIAPLACYSIMLVITPADALWQLKVAAGRLILHVAPAMILFIACVALDDSPLLEPSAQRTP